MGANCITVPLRHRLGVNQKPSRGPAGKARRQAVGNYHDNDDEDELS